MKNFLNKRNPPWVLITGGSHGIGRALTLECVDRGYAVAVAALGDHHLDQLRQELHARPGAVFSLLGTDLTAAGAGDRIEAWLDRQGGELHYLINNAGFGRGGCFEATPWAEYATMLALNNRVLVELTYRLLPRLLPHGGGILNLSSMEATMPLPYKTVYTGTKAFVYNFTLALRQELAHRGLSATVLCPGPVITNEDGMRRVHAQGWRAKLLVKLPEDIAPAAVDGMLAGRDVVRPGLLVRFLIGLSYVVPRRARMRILERLFRRYREEEEAPAAGAPKKSMPSKPSVTSQSRAASVSS